MAARKAAAAAAPSRAGTKRKAEDAAPEAPSKKTKAAATTRKPATTKKPAPAKENGRTRKAAPAKKAAAPEKAPTPEPQVDTRPKPAKAATGTKKTTAAATKKAAASNEAGKAKAATTTAAKSAGRKRKAHPETASPAPPAKLVKGDIINEPPTERLNAYVFGEGSAGELGLGTARNAVDVKRPRLNPNLAADKCGMVKVVAGGMHGLALTHDNKILSWGVNDQGALGRDTEWEGGLRDMDAAEEDSDSDSDDDDNGLNPKESIPAEVDWTTTDVAEGSRWTDIAAGDSCSFALTDDGRVYGWGTFRKQDGIFGFTAPGNIIYRPTLIPDLKNIKSIATGANFALALDANGAVFSWGCGEQCQLGRRVIVRTISEGLIPRQFGLPKGPKNGIASIATGNDHAFAISKNGTVYAWGNNTFGETGIKEGAGGFAAVVYNPTPIKKLKGKTINCIKGGTHHTVASTDNGECWAWGRFDAAELGIPKEDLLKVPDLLYSDDSKKPRAIVDPQHVYTIKGDVVNVSAAGDQCIAVTKDGKAWSWGFSANYQTGQGTDDDIDVATMMDNNAIREKHITGAQCGGQFGMILEKVDLLPNGV